MLPKASWRRTRDRYLTSGSAGLHLHHVSSYVCLLSTQVVELQNRLSEESKKADKMEFEYKRVKEKVDSLQKEKDVRRAELLTGAPLCSLICCTPCD